MEPQQQPANLYFNPARAPTHQCKSCVEENARKINAVRSEFGPVLCHRHRNNADPPNVGWAYITSMELEIVNYLRYYGWTEEALAELAEKAHVEETRRVARRFTEVNIASDEEQIVPLTITPRPRRGSTQRRKIRASRNPHTPRKQTLAIEPQPAPSEDDMLSSDAYTSSDQYEF